MFAQTGNRGAKRARAQVQSAGRFVQGRTIPRATQKTFQGVEKLRAVLGRKFLAEPRERAVHYFLGPVFLK